MQITKYTEKTNKKKKQFEIINFAILEKKDYLNNYKYLIKINC